jgi:hypothetical protein
MIAWLTLLACGGATDEAAPTLTFLAPADGEVVAAGDVAVSLVVEGVTLTEPTATARLDPTAWLPVGVAWAHGEGAEEGFVRLTLDGVDVGDVGTTQWTLPGVTAGAHTLTGAILFADGHDPGVSATVDFTAQ